MENFFLGQLDFTLLCRLWKEHKELFQMVDFKDGKHAIIKFDQSTIERLSAVSAEDSAGLQVPPVNGCGERKPEIVMDRGDRELRFYRTRMDEYENQSGEVSYSVLKYDTNAGFQELIDEGIDLEDEATDIARETSAGDTESVCVICKDIDFIHKYTDWVPCEVYEGGERKEVRHG